MRIVLAIASMFLSTWAIAGSFNIIDTSKKNVTIDQSKGPIIYNYGSTKIQAAKGMQDSDFEDVYAILTPHHAKYPEFLNGYGKVLDFMPNHVAIVRIPDKHIAEVSGLMHHDGLACGVLEALSNRPVFEGAIATPTPIIPVASRDARVAELGAKVTGDNIKGWVEFLSEMETRHHSSPTGRGVAELLAQKYAEMANGRADVTISNYQHSRTSQDSLVVRIEGQTKSDEVIVLGSHIDSISYRGSRSPGADDNASGTATNMEIFRILMESQIQLERTLEIHGYAAEEIGLVGSKEIAADYRRRAVNVVAMVQHDMNLWKASGTPDKIWFVSNNTNRGFNSQLTSLAGHYSGIEFGSASLSGGSSDHASWTREGFAAAFPFENPRRYNQNIHTSQDTIANSGAFDQAAAFAKLGLGYVAHFGGIN